MAGLDALREACLEMDVRMIACEAGLRAEALDAALLLPGVEVAGDRDVSFRRRDWTNHHDLSHGNAFDLTRFGAVWQG